ncbi:MAG: protease inhibitor I42 family protein [Actinomycetota bacterium]
MRRPALAAIALLVLVACSPKTLGVSEDRSGETVRIEPGQELRIELPENASVGYTWEVTTDPDPAVLEFIGSDYVADDPGTAGGGGTVSFRYAGTGPGTTGVVVSRDYRGEGIDKTFELTVEVGSGS